MEVERRTFVGAGLAATLLAASPIRAAAPPSARRLLDDATESLLATYPENASQLGIDTGARAHLRARLTDRSAAGVARQADAARARLGALRAVDAARLDPATRLDLEVARAAHELAVEGYAFGFGDVAVLNTNFSYRNGPYTVAQNMGAWAEIPDFLDSQHRVEHAADAEAYLARLAAYAAALDGETGRLRAEAARGVVAPAFLLDKTLRQQKAARAVSAAESPLAASLVRRTAAIPGDWGRRAERIVTAQVQPALDRQIAELERHRAQASGDAGVWHVPDGDAFYAWALRAATTTRLSPAEVHRMGLDQLGQLHGRMDAILKRQGLTQGSVGARMTALGKDPKHQFPNSDAGRQQILDYIGARIADIRARLPRAFDTLVPGRLIVTRVPPAIEQGARGGYAAPGAIDGSVPGNYYINLRDTALWPRYALPTLTYHEAIPGHIWQGEYSFKLPLIRALLAFNAYSEGWALYAEQLADELGVYEGDPLGELGYLQSIAFRACRLVVDTGLHAERWTRERAVRWFAETNGSSEEEVSSEVDRHCAWPGQACGYKVGHSEILRLREEARRAGGAGFDLKRFNDAVVMPGNVPLTLLPDVVRRGMA